MSNPTSQTRVVTVDVDGPVHVVDRGKGDPTLVLVHGLGSSHAIWGDAGAALAASVRVLAVDLPGFGYSPMGRRSASVDANARVLGGVIERVVGTPVVVVGNSMGGVVAMLLAASRPDLVSGLVLVNPGLRRPRGVHLDRKLVRMFGSIVLPVIGEAYLGRRWADLGPEGLVRASVEMSCVDPARVSVTTYAAMVDVVRHVHAAPRARLAYIEAARSLVRFAGSPRQHRALVGRPTQPTLLLVGSEDRVVPVAAAAAVAEQRPEWAYQVLDGLGHTPQLEGPREFAAAVAGWLDALEP